MIEIIQGREYTYMVKSMEIQIRPYQKDDCREMSELFYQTVHNINARDYSLEQRNVWATHASITAKPFFLKRGYHAVKEQQVIRAGISLTNYVMVLRKDNPDQ